MTIARPHLDDAACRGREDLYLMEKQTEQDRHAMRKICASCPERAPCLAYALRHERFGFWAGHTPGQRSKLRTAYGITLEEITPGLWL